VVEVFGGAAAGVLLEEGELLLGEFVGVAELPVFGRSVDIKIHQLNVKIMHFIIFMLSAHTPTPIKHLLLCTPQKRTSETWQGNDGWGWDIAVAVELQPLLLR